MRRRSFLESSIAVMSGLGPASSGMKGAVSAVGAATDEEPCSESRYKVLNALLDREAMQRGWARTVDPDYQHAPQSAIDAFQDLKFGIRIHWGLYCLIGSHESWGLAGANPQFWKIYNVLYQFFNPTDFDADTWMELFCRCGIRFFTFTTKHHDGFCMWPTKVQQQSPALAAEAFNRGCEHTTLVTNNYSIMDGPYRRDIVGALVNAARQKDVKIGLYYSHVDWHDPAFAWDPFHYQYDPDFTRQRDPGWTFTRSVEGNLSVRNLLLLYSERRVPPCGMDPRESNYSRGQGRKFRGWLLSYAEREVGWGSGEATGVCRRMAASEW